MAATSAIDNDQVWRELAEKAAGVSLDRLSRRTDDGLVVAPLYARARAPNHQPWRAERAWSIAQRVDHPNAERANRLALEDLEGGADALVLVDRRSACARGFGFDSATDDLDRVLEGVDLDVIKLRIDAGPATLQVLDRLTRIVVDRRLTSAALDVTIGFDPIGWGARCGRVMPSDAEPLRELTARGGLRGTLYLADGRPWHEAGASATQELATVLSTAVAYLRAQEALGLDAARDDVAMLLAADADIFVGLAKFRSMRRLWARVEEACQLRSAPLRLYAETSWRMMTRRDPWTNVMRTTAAAFAAGLGGADAIHVAPFTLPLGLPDAAARRLARNVSHVLLDEAHLAKVDDPAAGAGSFEALTDQLCIEAWRQFQEIERAGGIVRAIAAGTVQARIAQTAAERRRTIAHLNAGIIGTSRFSSLTAPEVAVLDVAPRPATDLEDEALPAQRDAAPFEALREGADALSPRPLIFLAAMGRRADHGPRVAEAENFFAAGGIAAKTAGEDSQPADLATAFAASGADAACLCGSDAAYAAEGRACATILRDAGARLVFAIGAISVDGIDASIHPGADALSILGEVLPR